MSLTKRGTDYESFSYLEKGKDYRSFDLAAEVGRVPGYNVQLSGDEEKRVEQLTANNIFISLHEHLGVFPADIRESPDYCHEGRMATAFHALRDAKWDAVFDKLMDGILNI